MVFLFEILKKKIITVQKVLTRLVLNFEESRYLYEIYYKVQKKWYEKKGFFNFKMKCNYNMLFKIKLNLNTFWKTFNDIQLTYLLKKTYTKQKINITVTAKIHT